MGNRKSMDAPPAEEPRPSETEMHEHAVFAAELGEAPSVDLHGLDRVEAIRVLDAEISRQAAAGTEVIEIIHGRGTGTLRREIMDVLKTHPLVAYFRDSQHPGKQGGVIYAALHEAKMKR